MGPSCWKLQPEGPLLIYLICIYIHICMILKLISVRFQLRPSKSICACRRMTFDLKLSRFIAGSKGNHQNMYSIHNTSSTNQHNLISNQSIFFLSSQRSLILRKDMCKVTRRIVNALAFLAFLAFSCLQLSFGFLELSFLHLPQNRTLYNL